MLNVKRTLIFGLLLLIAIVAKAQQDKVYVAYTFYQQEQLDSAKAAIDIAIAHPEVFNDYEAWSVRGLIYKEIYKGKEKTNLQSPARIEAINSFKKSISLDTQQIHKENNKKGIKSLVTSFYNNVSDNLDSIHYNTAIAMFDKYKEYYPLVDTSVTNLQKKEIEFLLALATVYTQNFNTDKTKTEFLTLAKSTYNKILAIDPNNISANFNMGVLYYNQAADLINKSDYDITLVALDEIQDNSISLFKQSLPFMEKAYSFDPKRKETLLGLSGIYFGLNDTEKSELFKQKLKEIEEQK